MTIYPESIDTDLSRLLTDVQNGSMLYQSFNVTGYGMMTEFEVLSQVCHKATQ